MGLPATLFSVSPYGLVVRYSVWAYAMIRSGPAFEPQYGPSFASAL